MKVAIYCFIVSSLLLSFFAQAEMELELKLGSWDADYSGDIGLAGSAVSFSELGYDDFDHDTLMATLRHPVPLVPNVHIQTVDLDSNGEGTISSSLTLDGITYSASEDVTSSLDLSFTDITLFYSPLSNWVTLDLGLTLRNFDGSVTATGSTTTDEADVEFDGWIPLLHGAAKFELPLTGFYVAATANIISYDGNGITDFTAAAGYAMSLPAAAIFAELGTRLFSIEAEDVDDVDDQDFDLDIDGALFQSWRKVLRHC